MNIKDAKTGQTLKVTGYKSGNKSYRHKLLTMGLVKGSEFTIVRKAPLGDPIEIKLRGFNLTLRKAEADTMELETV